MWTIFWLIWFVLSAFVMAVYGWSLKILYEQKGAWKKFAEKHKMEYRADKFTAPPYLTGRYKNHRLYAYSGAQATSDMGGQRYVTIIEIELGKGVPVAGALGTKNLGAFILELNFEHEYVPDSAHWDASKYTLRTRNARVLQKYLTEERIKALDSLFKMKNASVLYFFDDVESVLRIETPDPMRDAGRMEKIFDRIYKALDVLILTDQEVEILSKEMEKKSGAGKGTTEEHAAPSEEEEAAPQPADDKEEGTPADKKSEKAPKEKQNRKGSQKESKKAETKEGS